MRNEALLRRAAAEFFVEGFMAPEAERILANTAPEDQAEARKSLMPPRTVPDGAFTWIVYLLWLESVIELVDVPLTGIELEALMVLKRERKRFQAEHPPCPHCGMPNEAHALRCRECMGKIG
jgi:hypothetical protein